MHDTRTNTWSVPHFVPNVPGWKRAVQDVINGRRQENQPPPEWATHPEDFTAWHTGTWSDEDNDLEWLPKPINLGKLDELVINKN